MIGPEMDCCHLNPYIEKKTITFGIFVKLVKDNVFKTFKTSESIFE